MQKHVNLVDLVKNFPTNIYLQNLASIQKRTSPVTFAHLAEKSVKGSISNLSTKASTRRPAGQKTAYPEVRSQDGAMSNSSLRTSDVSSYVNAGMSIRPSDDPLVI